MISDNRMSVGNPGPPDSDSAIGNRKWLNYCSGRDFAPAARDATHDLCPQCGRRFARSKSDDVRELCAVCEPADGCHGRLCNFCWLPFHRPDGVDAVACNTHCAWMLDVQMRHAPWTVLPEQPVNDVDEPTETRICSQCGQPFRVPVRRRPGKQRERCYQCRPRDGQRKEAR